MVNITTSVSDNYPQYVTRAEVFNQKTQRPDYTTIDCYLTVENSDKTVKCHSGSVFRLAP